MSATNRGAERHAHDFYATPAWCVHRLVERVGAMVGPVLDPCCGDGALLRAAGRDGFTVDIQARFEPDMVANYLDDNVHLHYPTCIMNPPYKLAQEFIDKAARQCSVVYALTRLNFLASAKRRDWLASLNPTVYVLPNRPSFTADGRTDATDYCWLEIVRGSSTPGRLKFLALTPKEERCRKDRS